MFNRVEMDMQNGIGFHLKFGGNVKNLTVLVGYNANGKSFFNKMVWFASYMLNIQQTILLMRIKEPDEAFAKEVNKWFPLSFKNSDALTGWITLHKEDVLSFSLQIENGILKTFWLDIKKPEAFMLGEMGGAMYASKDTRTFESLARFTKLHKKIDPAMRTTEEIITELADFYPLYDVLYLIALTQKIKVYREEGLPPTVLFRIRTLAEKSSGDFAEVDAEQGYFSFENDMPELITTTHNIPLDELSSGTQAMIMVVLFLGK